MQQTGKNLIVDNPILNDPFKEPTRHWVYGNQTNTPRIETFRRGAHYYFRAHTRKDVAQTALLAEEAEIVLEKQSLKQEPDSMKAYAPNRFIMRLPDRLLQNCSKNLISKYSLARCCFHRYFR